MLRSWVLFAGAVAGGIALAIFYDPGIGFAILYGAGLYLLLGLVSILAAPSCLHIGQEASADTVFKGEELSYTLEVKNRGPFFYPRLVYIFYHPDLNHFDEQALPTGAGEPFRRAAREYRIRYPYRGVYRLGVEKLTVTDLFGLFRRTLRTKTPLTVTALPVSDEQFALAIRHEPQYVSRRTFHEDYTSVADIRRYDHADSLRKVHWKLSAKRGELMVKSYHNTEQGRTLLYLDTVALPLEPQEAAAFEDKVVGCVAAAVDYCLLGNLPTGIVYGEAGVDEAAVDPGEELGVYALLADVRFDRDVSPLASLEHVEGDDSMLLFLSSLDESVHDTLKERISFDHDVTLYFFYSDVLPLTDETEFLLDSLEAWGVGVHKVDLDSEVMA